METQYLSGYFALFTFSLQPNVKNYTIWSKESWMGYK